MSTKKIKIIKNEKVENKNKNKDKGDMIKPEKWVLQNKKRFPGWINKTFLKYQTKEIPGDTTAGKFRAFSYQKFLRDYMQNSSPYRGILLYHGLGSGKTCSSILIAENLKSVKNIIIMLPAALKSNFIGEGLKFCGDESYKNMETGNAKIDEKYIFVSYNAPNKVKQLDNLGSLDNHVIIIEEVHNLISIMSGENTQGKEIYKRLMEANNCKIVALSGTPLQNYAFEAGVLFNILRGYMEETIFTIAKVTSGDLLQLEKIFAEMEEVDIVEVHSKNKTISIYFKIPSWNITDYNKAVEEIIKRGQQSGVTLKRLRINTHALFPEDEDRFLDYFIDSSGEDEEFKNKNLFRRRILGLVSYYSSKKKDFPEVEIHPPVEVAMSSYQYEMYELARELLERKLERMAAQRGKSKKRGAQKIPSNFRVYSRQFSNFVFPEEIPRPFRKPGFVLSVGKKNNNTNEEIAEMMKKESDIQENNSEISKDYQKRMSAAIAELKAKASTYLTPSALADSYSPKMARMLEMVNKTEGLVLVYSNFRKMEGIEVFSQILAENGYLNFIENVSNAGKKPTYAIFSGEEDFKLRNKVIKLFTSANNKSGKYIKILMITRAGAEGLDLKNIRSVLIMEPYWNNIRIDQVIGRAVRRNSHRDLPPKERKVDVYLFQSILSEKQRQQAKEKLSTDQYIADVAQRKKRLINEILDMMKEMAVDCVLNTYDNEGNIKCFSFGDIMENNKELAYLPKINEDLIYVDDNANRKVVEKVFTPALIDEKGMVVMADMKKKQLYYIMNTARKAPLVAKPKSIYKVALDMEGKKVYDIKSVKSENPVLIGEYDEMGRYVEY